MKWLILLLLIGVAGVFFATRYRRQIQTAIYLWRMFRKMRQLSKSGEKQIEEKGNSKDVPLVRCAKCGTWISQTKALNLRSKAFYCSAVCMENAVKAS
ncbi:MAG: hypothetical protein M3033_09295 [Acidobacteriota bacterium]|nr:hypothetical protein [Acidobacteriota bacterium]